MLNCKSYNFIYTIYCDTAIVYTSRYFKYIKVKQNLFIVQSRYEWVTPTTRFAMSSMRLSNKTNPFIK